MVSSEVIPEACVLCGNVLGLRKCTLFVVVVGGESFCDILSSLEVSSSIKETIRAMLPSSCCIAERVPRTPLPASPSGLVVGPEYRPAPRFALLGQSLRRIAGHYVDEALEPGGLQ